MQLQVAAELGIDASTIAQWRRGVGMSGDVAVRLAIWMDVDLRAYARQVPARPPADPAPAVSADAA
jgi:transcriptional regulator with XRE-family HTH domain